MKSKTLLFTVALFFSIASFAQDSTMMHKSMKKSSKMHHKSMTDSSGTMMNSDMPKKSMRKGTNPATSDSSALR